METAGGEFGGNIPIGTLLYYHMMWTSSLLATLFRHQFDIKKLIATAALLLHNLENERRGPLVRRAENGEQITKSVRQRGGGGGEVAFFRVNDNADRRIDFARFLIGYLDGLRQYISNMQWFIKMFIYFIDGLHGVVQRHFTVHSGGIEEMGHGVSAVRRKIVAVRYGQFVISH
uniref:Uncharacterized protein n=1 Tax=Podoviridae sp. ctx8L26 TaxID=2826588 RepID=A0A8S5MWI2_9CAUD|nr:MAG TPA: hypothetical protein [Podoviridae sp. ctx8L26]DAD86774.1 MAG TPA: hypothetical protein [Podoviridae sp. ctx8L26]